MRVMFDDEPAHDARGVAHEAGAIGEGGPVPLGHLQIGLVQERGDAQAGALSAPAQLAAGEIVELRVESREERVRGVGVAFFRGRDERGDRTVQGNRLRRREA